MRRSTSAVERPSMARATGARRMGGASREGTRYAPFLQLGSELDADSMHTLQTNVKRTRFRADASSDDDMLDSCFSLNCDNIRARPPRARSSASGRRTKRACPTPRDMADDDDDDDGNASASRYTEESGIAEIARGVGAMGQKGKVPRRTKAVARKPKPSATTTTAETSAPARLR